MEQVIDDFGVGTLRSRKLPCQVDSSEVEFPASTFFLKAAGGSAQFAAHKENPFVVPRLFVQPQVVSVFPETPAWVLLR